MMKEVLVSDECLAWLHPDGEPLCGLRLVIVLFLSQLLLDK